MRPITWYRLLCVPASICVVAGLYLDPVAYSQPQQPTHAQTDPLTRENGYLGGSPPAGAIEISPEEFRRGVANGSISLITAQGMEDSKRAQAVQLARDRATLRAIPQATASPAIQALLDSVEKAADPFAHPTMTLRQPDGTIRQVVLLSLAEALHQAAMAWTRTGSPDNALNAYRQAWQASPADVRAGLPNPERLPGASLDEINAVRLRLDGKLGARSDRDQDHTAAETAPPPAASPNASSLLHPVSGGMRPVVTAPTAATAGAPGPGIDGPGTCTHNNNGVYLNVWWPLKRFVSPIKQQGSRGTCWTFAAVGALESALQVQHDLTTDISEQWFVWRYKSSVAAVPGHNGDQDGGSAESSLDTSASSEPTLTYPQESFWRYNPSDQRNDKADAPDVYKNACNEYTGQCSASVHQGPLLCTKLFVINLTVCGSKTVTPVGGVAKPISTTTVWAGGQDLPLATLRAYLADGHALLASFGVYPGFVAAQGNGTGVVTDLKTEDKSYGGNHELLIVGYVGNATLEDRTTLAPSNGEGLFILKNSWGCSGDGGYYFVPVSYLSKVFLSLSILNMSNDRSPRWLANLSGPALPTATITKPYYSQLQSGQAQILVPMPVDFSKPVVFQGQIDDPQDGKKCCLAALTWSSKAQGNVASGVNSFTLIPKAIGPGSMDTVTLASKDSDGNTVSTSLTIIDDYPVVTISKPLANATVFNGASFAVQGAVMGSGTNTPLSCGNLVWKADWWSGSVQKTGCTVTIQATVTGHRTLTATYTGAGRAPVSATVSLNVVPKAASGPPIVNLQILGGVDGGSGADATIAYGFTDPGGPGDADLSKYKLVWTATYNGTTKPLYPFVILNTTHVEALLSKLFAIPGCGGGGSGMQQTITVTLQVTDSEGLTGSRSVDVTFGVPGCIG